MPTLTNQEMRDALGALMSQAAAADQTAVEDMMARQIVEAEVGDNATAGTAGDERVIYRNQSARDMRVVAAHIVTPAAETANDTNYATFRVQRRNSDGSSAVTVASGALTTTGLGNLTAFSPAALTLTAANVIVASGRVLTADITKTGTGIALSTAGTNNGASPRFIVVLEPA